MEEYGPNNMLSGSTNPFDVDDTSPLKNMLSETQLSGPAHFEKIANFLIKENFPLTALEFYMELIEMGHEVVKLREYFSNPENFEKSKFSENSTNVNKLIRTSSIQTFDSLDFSRYSDDGDRGENDKIFVLEFELRKAQEKINSLRSALTKSSETAKKIHGDSKIKIINSNFVLFEKRAMNFLVNEYLLKQGYKLTSVTFSEENDSQDFDDWDDVGLNISKPCDLMSLFHNLDQKIENSVEKKDFECMAKLDDINSDDIFENKLCLQEKINELEKNLLDIIQENGELKQNINKLSSGSVDENSIKNVENIKSKDNIVNKDSEEKTLEKDFENKTNAHVLSVKNEIKNDSFQNYLIKFILDQDFYQDLHYHDSENSLIHFDKLIVSLGNALPKIVPNILVAKRDQLLPLLIYTVMHHTSSKKRDEVLKLIFNLIKRPDEAQRRIIMKGCLTFSKNMGSLKVESELLPQCWEQITHKYLERRLLVAETCGVLSPYVHDDTRASLLFSMIKQLADDKEEELREATVKSFSILISFIENNHKYSQITELIEKFMHDSSERVLDACIKFLLPSMSRWCLHLNCLQQFVSEHLLTGLEKSTCKLVFKDSASLIIKDVEMFKNAVSSLHQVLPYIFALIIKTSPPFNTLKTILTVVKCKDVELSSDFQSKILKQNIKETGVLIDNYYNVINEEWFECWSELYWFANNFILRLIDFLSRLEISPPLIKLVIKFFQTISSIFGANFIATQVKFRFDKYLSMLNDQMHPNTSFVTMSIVPVYVAGIHPSIILSLNQAESLKHKESLTQFLCHLLSSLSISCLPLTSIQSAFVELSRYDDLKENSKPIFRELLLKVLWEFGVVHKNVLIRVSTSRMFEWLISNCDYSEAHISSKVLPALITLAHDHDDAVKVSTISPFGSLIEYLSNTLNVDNPSKIFDKIQIQIKTFMGDQTSTFNNNNIIIEIIKVLGKIGPRIDAKLRDEFVLPRLTTLAIKNQITQNLDPNFKLDITLKLLDAFISALCCYVDDKISHEVILPGLRCLLHDIQNVAPNRADVVSSMIRELEEKTNHKKQGMELHSRPQAHTISNSEAPKNTIFNKFRDAKGMTSNKSFSKIFQSSHK